MFGRNAGTGNLGTETQRPATASSTRAWAGNKIDFDGGGYTFFWRRLPVEDEVARQRVQQVLHRHPEPAS